MKRRFAELNPAEALQAAILVEIRNTKLYENLAQTFASYDAALSTVFKLMAEEEARHRSELEAYLDQHFPGEGAANPSNMDVVEVLEAPDLEEPEAFIFDNVTVEQAIAMAESAESRASDFYQTMALQVNDPKLRALCLHLAEVESQHRTSLKQWKQS